jgi:nitrile hydratase
MNGAQDMGGMHGFGPIVPEREDGPKFHADWEKRAMALTIAAGATGAWNIDMSRHARESLPPAEYLTIGYYGTWLRGIEKLLVACGLATGAEVASGHAVTPPAPGPRVLRPEAVPAVLARGAPTARAAATPPAFAVGDRVRARVMNPAGHTRLPRYVRGHVGTVAHCHGAHVFPDTHAHGRGEQPQHLYTVVFDGADLWGEGGEPGTAVSVDAWESYLERT